jgi:predicted DCC family thiol-disulfide oxidoreductase YuxK
VHGRAELVLYDADCGICSSLAAWLARRGVRVSPIRSGVGDVELRDLTRTQRDAAVHVVDDRGRRRSGAEALPPILRSLPRLAWTAGLVEAAPAPFRLGYALVARHRRRLSRLAGVRGCEIR